MTRSGWSGVLACILAVVAADEARGDPLVPHCSSNDISPSGFIKNPYGWYHCQERLAPHGPQLRVCEDEPFLLGIARWCPNFEGEECATRAARVDWLDGTVDSLFFGPEDAPLYEVDLTYKTRFDYGVSDRFHIFDPHPAEATTFGTGSWNTRTTRPGRTSITGAGSM